MRPWSAPAKEVEIAEVAAGSPDLQSQQHELQ